MIEVKELTKRYGNKTAVDRISFSAGAGEILGILGPNGAGKTSTMRMLTGFMPPTDGSATLDGFDIVADSMEVRRRVGYMPERVPLYPDMTVEEYVRFWAKLRGVRRPQKSIEAVLDRVQLLDRRRSLVRSLSKGLKQRLGLAQTLVHNPKVIILDEPTIGIDPQQVIEVRAAVRDLAHNHTVLFSTHILSEAEQVCDRVIILNQGRIVAEGTPAELRQKLYPGDSVFVQIGGVGHAKPEKTLRGINGVKQVQKLAGGYALEAVAGRDIRADVVKRIQQAGWTLLELRPVAVTLEDIFLKIVSREDAEEQAE
ncbi:MAG: ABC transporter ATP-binding protein [Anaerolineaceae bacterium]|nr:MAG: ABC transporter ATP-binding protein [Anaerolineaceae bacterium]